jgi:hypothetical protein
VDLESARLHVLPELLDPLAKMIGDELRLERARGDAPERREERSGSS